ncbi:MAG: DUF6364 family protein [Balneolia bacterium]|nr:DUF6364 family protein [Balneolia bacterium]
MNKKLTLYISEDVISRAKAYAQEKGTSVSGLVEDYLAKQTSAYSGEPDAEGKVEEEFVTFFGVIELSDDFDEKDEVMKLRQEKHR